MLVHVSCLHGAAAGSLNKADKYMICTCICSEVHCTGQLLVAVSVTWQARPAKSFAKEQLSDLEGKLTIPSWSLLRSFCTVQTSCIVRNILKAGSLLVAITASAVTEGLERSFVHNPGRPPSAS